MSMAYALKSSSGRLAGLPCGIYNGEAKTQLYFVLVSLFQQGSIDR